MLEIHHQRIHQLPVNGTLSDLNEIDFDSSTNNDENANEFDTSTGNDENVNKFDSNSTFKNSTIGIDRGPINLETEMK